MIDMDSSIRRLYDEKKISARAALDKAIDKSHFKDLRRGAGPRGPLKTQGGITVDARVLPPRLVLVLAVLALLSAGSAGAADSRLELQLDRPLAVVRPLDPVTVNGPAVGILSVLDGRGREYVRAPRPAGSRSPPAAPPGRRPSASSTRSGTAVESVSFRLEPRTLVEDAGGRMEALLASEETHGLRRQRPRPGSARSSGGRDATTTTCPGCATTSTR